MKKVVRMLGLCALVALAFTACKKNDTQKATFSATITQPTSSVRTHAAGSNDYYLVWDEGDVIKVFNNNDDYEEFTLTSGKDSETATFEVVGEKVSFLENLETDDYVAFYPNAEFNADEQVELNVNEEQTYKAYHNFLNGTYPMVGFNNATDNFQFESKCGFLYLIFQGPEPAPGEEPKAVYFDRVVVTADETEDYLNGTYIYDTDGSYARFEGGTNQSIITSASRLSVTYPNLMDVTFVLPEGALASGFTVDVYDGDELVWTRHAPAEINAIVAQQYREMPSMVLVMPEHPTK